MSTHSSNAWWRGIVGAVLGAALILSGTARSAKDSQSSVTLLVRKGNIALSKWDYRGALEISRQLFEMAEKEGDLEAETRAHLFKARYCFYAGDYPCARDELALAEEIRGLDDEGAEFLERMKKLALGWEGYKEARSEHFILRYMPGKDEVLIEPALASLELSYSVLTRDFQVEPNEPALVEIYPDFKTFGVSVGIPDEDIENSGTIAICKYRRLMVNSPRNLTRGYAYLDTLSHEYVHFLIYERFGGGVPIWLHEGIAKYEEARWRGDPGGELTPSQKSLLASALRQGELISFDRMHPSFAYLKTPRQGQLAFSEVCSVVEYLIELGGWDLIFKLCKELTRNRDYRKGIQKVTGVSFDRFWSDWIMYARGAGYKELPGMEISVFEIRKGEEGFDEVDEGIGESDISGGEQWRYARLGDLLRDRGHFQAAGVEYAQAREISPYSTKILNKQGLCFHLAKDYKGAVEPLQKAIELSPSFSTSYINLGRSLYAGGDEKGAAEVLEKALEINPFNPIAYNYLIKIYDKEGNEERARKLAGYLDIISGKSGGE